jgi:hypothetical protein
VASGTIRQLTNNPANDYAPAYSPVTASIAFVSEREDRRGVWAVDTATATERSLRVGRRPVGAVVEPGRLQGDLQRHRQQSQQPRHRWPGGHLWRGSVPFRAQWISATEILYTADGKIKTRGVAGGDAVSIEFTAPCRSRTPYKAAVHDFDSRSAQLCADYGAGHFARWAKSRSSHSVTCGSCRSAACFDG